MPLPSMQLRSFRCHCSALHFSSMQLNAFAILFRAPPSHCNSIRLLAIQLISIHRHCGSNRRSSHLRLSQSARILSSPCHRVAFPFSTLPLLIRASPHRSLLRHCDSMLVSAFAMLYISSPCLCSSERSAALPLQVYSLQRSAMAFLCSATPGLAIAIQR